MTKQQTSGLEKVPRILKKPLWTDRFFWMFVATLAFWGLALWWLIGS